MKLGRSTIINFVHYEDTKSWRGRQVRKNTARDNLIALRRLDQETDKAHATGKAKQMMKI